MAICPVDGLLLLGSSVHRRVGFMYRRFKKLHGNDDADDICWFAPSGVMNPVLPAHVIDRALSEDSAKARAEYQNIWREDLSTYIPADVVDGCTDFGVHERAPEAGTRYVAYCDSSSGVADSFAIAIAHRTTPHGSTPQVLLDVVRERKPRFVPAQVISEYAELLLKLYGISEVQSDRYAVGFHEHEWRTHGIKFTACERTTSENYLHCLPLLLANRVRLVDSMTLRGQLAALERRVGAGDKESVTHPQHANAHDDVACAACGALALAARYSKYRYPSDMNWVRGEASAVDDAAAAVFQRERFRRHILVSGGYYNTNVLRRW